MAHGVCVCSLAGKNNIKEGDPHGSRGHQNQCSVHCVRHPVWRPSGSQLGASPRPEPLVGRGYVTSVPACPCLAVSCCSTHARFARGHEATDTGLTYAPVSQAHGHHHIVQCFSLLHCSADQF